MKQTIEKCLTFMFAFFPQLALQRASLSRGILIETLESVPQCRRYKQLPYTQRKLEEWFQCGPRVSRTTLLNRFQLLWINSRSIHGMLLLPSEICDTWDGESNTPGADADAATKWRGQAQVRKWDQACVIVIMIRNLNRKSILRVETCCAIGIKRCIG